MPVIRWWRRLKRSYVPWGAFGIIDDPTGVFYDYRARVVQSERTMHRINRRYFRNALRRLRRFP